MVEEISRIYIIPLRKAKRKPRIRRASAAIKIISEFLQRHMKSENVKIGNDLNEFVWKRGIHKIPSKVKVSAVKRDNVIYAKLAK